MTTTHPLLPTHSENGITNSSTTRSTQKSGNENVQSKQSIQTTSDRSQRDIGDQAGTGGSQERRIQSNGKHRVGSSDETHDGACSQPKNKLPELANCFEVCGTEEVQSQQKQQTSHRSSINEANSADKSIVSGSYLDAFLDSNKASRRPATRNRASTRPDTQSTTRNPPLTGSAFDETLGSDDALGNLAIAQSVPPSTTPQLQTTTTTTTNTNTNTNTNTKRRRLSKTELKEMELTENKKRKRKMRLRPEKEKEVQHSEHKRLKNRQIEPNKRAQTQARLEAKRQEKLQEELEDKLKKRIVKLERYLENGRLLNRLDRDAVNKELADWKSELNKLPQERISLEKFKERSRRKLRCNSKDEPNSEHQSATGEMVVLEEDDDNGAQSQNILMREKKHKRVAEREEQRQLKMARKEAKFVEKVQKRLSKNYAKEVTDRQRRIAVLERVFSNSRTKYRSDMPQLWEELYTLKQEEQERLIEEYESGGLGDATQLSLLPVFSPVHQEIVNRDIKVMKREIQSIEPKVRNPRGCHDLTALNERLGKLKAECEKLLGTNYGCWFENVGETSGIDSKDNTVCEDHLVLTKDQPFRLPNENYIKFYNRVVGETLDPTKSIPELPLSASKVSYDGTYPNDAKYPGQFWTGEQKELFFTLLARYSIHQLDMISLHMGKSELEIMTYYNLLKRELSKLKNGARRSGKPGLKKWDYRLVQYEEIPAAYEMSKYFTKLEDEQSLLIDADEKVQLGSAHVDTDACRLLNRNHMRTMFGRTCADDTCHIMEDLVKQVTTNILVNIINAKTTKSNNNDLEDESKRCCITILPKNVKSALTRLGYPNLNAIFNCNNPYVKKVYTEKYGQHRWFNNLRDIVSVPAFANLVPAPQKPTIRTIHNLNQYDRDLTTDEDTIDEEFESNLFELETKTIDEHDLLESRMYEHALLMMLLDHETDVSAGDLKRLKRWERECSQEEKEMAGGVMGSVVDVDASDERSDDQIGDHADSADALKMYSRDFARYKGVEEETRAARTANETDFEKEQSPVLSDGTLENFDDDKASIEGVFDGFFVRHFS
ncbi:hypothetical protein KGF57_004151 [Candida theae]|uniref:Myb-like domain-containing protein n=1 Tax=Candida theae TaxID=1198502 RepID=A0AAD5BC65_9ASCO|nr:uncharacterized protein KGF57_004151 [Candida theae]KAI5952187.1 hypothetical protein KGF57_004151 [Candida theae]